MKKILMTTILAAAAWLAQAQTPAPESDTTKVPSKQTDPEVKQEPAGLNYIDEMTRITADELPAAVLDSLKKLEPQTWEKSVVYKQKKEDTYKVEIRDGGEERFYRFTKEGKRIKTLDEMPRKKNDD